MEATRVADIQVLILSVLFCMYSTYYLFLLGGFDFLIGLIRALF